jgi:hypothetical protein
MTAQIHEPYGRGGRILMKFHRGKLVQLYLSSLVAIVSLASCGGGDSGAMMSEGGSGASSTNMSNAGGTNVAPRNTNSGTGMTK